MIFIIIFLTEDAKAAYMQELSWQLDSGCSWVAITLHIPGRELEKLKIVQKKGRVNRVSEIKLKPCLFCGGEAVLKRDRIGLYCVKCTNCGCMTTFQFDFGEGEEASKRKAADVWNRRTDNETD